MAGTPDIRRLRDQFGGGGAVGRVLRHAPPDQLPHRVRQGGRLVRRLVEVAAQHGERFPGVRRTAGHQLVQGDADGVHVGGRLRLAADRLRGHVVRRPDDRLGGGEAGGVQHPGDPEIGEPHLEPAGDLLEQDVVRLDVAVHHAQLVRLGERGRDLGEQVGGLGRRERPERAQPPPQAAAGHVVHHQGERAADAEQVPDADDVLVPHHHQDRAFLDEPDDQLRLPEQPLVQQLHRHALAGRAVYPAPHGAGGAVPDRADEDVRVAHAAAAEIGGCGLSGDTASQRGG
jgi:hypothetical protein